MSDSELAALQSSLKFTTKRDDIIANREQIKVVRAKLQAQLKVVDALSQANMSLCTHPERRTYNDPRDPGGWDCPTCGAGG